MNRLVPRPVLWLVAATLAAAACRGPSRPPPPASSRDERWRQDLNYLAANLRRLHADAFANVRRGDFDAEVDRIAAAIPSSSESQILTEMSGLVARLGDAHTRLVLATAPWLTPASLQIVRFDDGYRVMAAPPDRPGWLGAEIAFVGRTPIDEAVARIGSIIPHENDLKARDDAADLMRVPAVLHALGLLDGPAELRLSVLSLAGVRQEIAPPLRRPGEPALVDFEDVIEMRRPVSRTRLDESYWHTSIPEHRAVYVAFGRCHDDPNRPFEQLAREVLAAVDAGGIERVILDLRRNGGGAQSVARPLLKGLARRASINAPDRLFLLMGSGTLSSALCNAIEFRQWTRGTIIGGPTGQKPNHFGEVRRFELPNSHLQVTYSTRHFRFVPGDPSALFPDVEAPMTFEQWRAGHDPALEAALTWRAGA